jgi:hypothetical protein
MGAVKFLTARGLFIGQSEDFFDLLRDLAEEQTRPDESATELVAVFRLKAPPLKPGGARFLL